MFCVLLLGIAASLAWSPVTRAACSDSQIIKLHDKGISTAKIADRCEMERRDVQAVIDEQESAAEIDEPAPAPPPRQAYCCDGYGNSRCPIVVGGTDIGTPCFCPGQGYGQICR
jgi:hypothetical protein